MANFIYDIGRRRIETLFRTETQSLPWPRRVLLGLSKLLYMTARKTKADLCFERAASLAFTSAIAFVPIAILLFSLFRAVGDADQFNTSVDSLIEFAVENVSADGQDKVRESLERLRDTIAQQAQGVASLAMVILIVTVLSLYRSAERTFSSIWNVAVRKGYLQKLGTFWLLLTAAPLFLGASIYVKGYLNQSLSGAEVEVVAPAETPGVDSAEKTTTGKETTATATTSRPRGFVATLVLSWLFPTAISWGAFTLLFLYLPNTRVRLRLGLIGALVAAVGWQLSTQCFSLYLKHAVLTGVYGALGVVPFFLLWIYLSWLIAIFGAELVYTMQHYRLIEREIVYHIDRQRTSPPVHGVFFMERIYRSFRGHLQAPTIETLAAEFQLPMSEAERTIEHLRSGGFVVADADGALSPRHAPEALTPLHVMEVFPTGSGFRLPLGADLSPTAVTDLMRGVRGSTDRALGEVSFADLVPVAGPKEPGAGEPSASTESA
ncbi:MAG: YihY/virulence factor BrkB family protein [Planctomycetota bacterium]